MDFVRSPERPLYSPLKTSQIFLGGTLAEWKIPGGHSENETLCRHEHSVFQNAQSHFPPMIPDEEKLTSIFILVKGLKVGEVLYPW
jgi:hypothetical protein